MSNDTPRRPNVLFFFTDDQRFDTLGALNNPNVITPNLDALVTRGTAFTNGYIMGGSSGAVCMPSRAMLHTGRTLYHLQGQGQEIPDEHALLGEALQSAGYHTFGTGKWHNGPKAYARSFGDGAEIFFGGMGDHWNVPACDYDPTGQYRQSIHQTTDFHTQAVRQWTADHIRAGKHSSELFAEAAVDFLARRGIADGGERDPFFAYVSFMAPHDPRTMPPEYLGMYDPADVDLPASFMPGHPFDNGELVIRDEVLAPFPRTEEEVRRHIAAYYAMITHADAQIGRVLAALEACGETDNTIVVFAGDNGLAVGRHGLMGKQSCYEHSVHVPLVFAGPGVPHGETRDAFACLIDIFPTLCDLTGSEIPDSVEGKSLVPTMGDPEESVRDHLLFAYRNLHRAVRGERYKLIEYVVKGNRTTQLFDLLEDPDELMDLSGDPDRAGEIETLRGELRRWQTELDDDQAGQGGPFWEGFDAD